MAPAPTPPTLGIDVGGTKVAAAVVVGRKVQHAIEHPTNLASEDGVLKGIEEAAREVIEHAGTNGPVAVGVGVPSQIDFATGRIMSSVNIPLEGVELATELQQRLGMPAFVDNDANCAALAEAHHVTPGPARNLVMYTLGTGVGGGVVIDGRIFRGATGLGAELGHTVVQHDGPDCPGNCPNRGCLEALCSGTALERDATAIAHDFPESKLHAYAQEHGHCMGRDVVAAADEGDKQALEVFDRIGYFLGIGLSNAINTFEPERIVIGGGMSNASRYFLDRAIAEARRRALPTLAERVDIGLAQAGPLAGLIGAGLLALHEHGSGQTGDTAGATATEGAR